jgi:hypothetical protein
MARTDYIVNRISEDYLQVTTHVQLDGEDGWTDKGLLFDVYGKELVNAIETKRQEVFKVRRKTQEGYHKQIAEWNAFMEAVYLGYRCKRCDE